MKGRITEAERQRRMEKIEHSFRQYMISGVIVGETTYRLFLKESGLSEQEIQKRIDAIPDEGNKSE